MKGLTCGNTRYQLTGRAIIKYSGGNRGVDNEVGVVATFPARLRILRVVCVLCVQKNDENLQTQIENVSRLLH